MIEGYYAALTSLFSPILGFPPMLGEIFLAILITFVITLFYRFFIDQNKIRDLKKQQKEYQAEIKKLQGEKKTEEANKKMTEMLKLSNQMMKANFKILPLTMLLVLAILPWMARTFTGPIVVLPFNLPYFGNDFGWLMWYFLLSLPLTQFFRKMMGVE
jgi:uncharacterized membrane protein (DUF106 family)